MTSSAPNSDSNDSIDIFIVDDHPPICEAVKHSLETTSGMTVCGDASTVREGFRQIEEIEPDVAVIDLSLEQGHGLDLVENVHAHLPRVEVLVFSMYDENVYAERAIRAGASGYLMKTQPTEQLVEAVQTVVRGETALSHRLSSRLLNQMVRGESTKTTSPLDELTDRELEVFQMLGQGKSLDDIQEELSLSRKTIETYRRRAKEKLDFDNVSQLLRYAVWWTHGRGTNTADPHQSPLTETVQ